MLNFSEHRNRNQYISYKESICFSSQNAANLVNIGQQENTGVVYRVCKVCHIVAINFFKI